MSYVFDPITGTFVYQSQFPEAPDFRRPGAPNYRLPEPPQDETIMYEQPLVPQRPVAASPVQPRMWAPPRREFGMTEADLLPPVQREDIPPPPPPAPPVPVNPMVDAFNRNRPSLFGMFGSSAPAAEPPAVLTAATVDPDVNAQAQPDPPAAAPTTTVQPPVTPPATTPAVQPPSPVTAALGAPGQPAADPFADHFQTMTRFEGTGVNPTSGASGFGQVLPSTYADWVTRFGARFPWMPRTLEEYRNAPLDVQQRVYREIVYPNEYQPALQNAGLEFTPLNAAVVNFLGPTGGVRFLQGANQNPSAPGTSLVSPAAVEANRNVFFDRDGRERNAGEVLQHIAQGGGRSGGALTAANGGTADQRTNAAATSPTMTTPQEANPYRERLQQLLTSIEGERNSRPDTGELLLRMGSGILSGRDLMDGLGRGGASVAELMQQTRQDNARRDQTLVGGFQGLVNDRRFQEARTTYGAPSNIEWRDAQGRPQRQAARMINGEPHLLQNGQWVPAVQVTGTADFSIVGRNNDSTSSVGVDGIMNADTNSRREVGGVTIDNPSFSGIRGVEALREHTRARELITSGVRLRQIEDSGIDPSSLSVAIATAVQRTPQGANASTLGAEIARRTGLSEEEGRMYAMNFLRYLNAIGRISSGAAITQQEWGIFEGQAMARFGDTSRAIEEVRNIRDSTMRNVAAGQGSAAPFLNEVIEGRRHLDAPFQRRSAGNGQSRPQAQPPAAPAAQGTTGGVNWSIRPSN